MQDGWQLCTYDMRIIHLELYSVKYWLNNGIMANMMRWQTDLREADLKHWPNYFLRYMGECGILREGGQPSQVAGSELNCLPTSESEIPSRFPWTNKKQY